jgi:RNA polymerase sigma factor (sigma-70 family)
MPDGLKSDGELYKLAASGDRDAVRDLVERYHNDLVLYIRAKTNAPGIAEDAAADTWLRFFRHLKEAAADPSRALRKPESVRFWLYRTALNSMRDQFRGSARQADLSEKVTSEAKARGMTSYEQNDLANIEGEERRSILREAFAKLNDGCRELLSLMSADPPLSYKDIAELLQRPVGSLGPSRQRCLESLRRHLVGFA